VVRVNIPVRWPSFSPEKKHAVGWKLSTPLPCFFFETSSPCVTTRPRYSRRESLWHDRSHLEYYESLYQYGYSLLSDCPPPTFHLFPPLPHSVLSNLVENFLCVFYSCVECRTDSLFYFSPPRRLFGSTNISAFPRQFLFW